MSLYLVRTNSDDETRYDENESYYRVLNHFHATLLLSHTESFMSQFDIITLYYFIY